MELDAKALEQIRNIQIHAKFLANAVFSGEYVSAFKGQGMEFEEVKEYLPGDDIRNIDWNVTARSDRAYIKTYRDERELTVIFAIDVSASMHFGNKNKMAAEIAALLAYAALNCHDKVGLLIFSDKVEHYIPAKKGKGHVWRIIRDVLNFRAQSKLTDLKVPLDFLNQALKKKSIVFLLSDFYHFEAQKEMQLTSKHHDLVALMLNSSNEISLPKVGWIELENSEGEDSVILNTSSELFQRRFKEANLKRLEHVKNFCYQNKIDWLLLDSMDDCVKHLIRFFKAREKKR